MNKIKLAFIAIAILTAIGGAYATRPCFQCEQQMQYYFTGAGYVEVGEWGADWDCTVGSGGTCTYYRPDPAQPNVYAPCHQGAYVPL